MKVLMFSGGLDSACAWHILDKPRCLYCGGYDGPAREANAGELRALEALLALDPTFAQCLTAKAFDWTPFMRKGHYTLPRENILAICAWAEGYNTVLYAWNRNDNPDPERIEHMIRVTTATVDMDGFTSDFPVWRYYKHELVQRALGKGAHPTWSHAYQGHGHLELAQSLSACHRRSALQHPNEVFIVLVFFDHIIHAGGSLRMNSVRSFWFMDSIGRECQPPLTTVGAFPTMDVTPYYT